MDVQYVRCVYLHAHAHTYKLERAHTHTHPHPHTHTHTHTYRFVRHFAWTRRAAAAGKEDAALLEKIWAHGLAGVLGKVDAWRRRDGGRAEVCAIVWM